MPVISSGKSLLSAHFLDTVLGLSEFCRSQKNNLHQSPPNRLTTTRNLSNLSPRDRIREIAIRVGLG